MGILKYIKDKSKSNPQCSTCGKKGYSIDGRCYGCKTCNCVWDAQAKFEQELVLIKEHDTVVEDRVW